MTVTSLTPGQTYYFALRTLDDSDNLSNLSNSPSAEAILRFTGKQVSLIFTRYTTRGEIEITIDDGDPVLLNQYGTARSPGSSAGTAPPSTPAPTPSACATPAARITSTWT